VWHTTQHLDPVLQLMSFPHLLDEQFLVAIPSHDEMHVWEASTNHRNYSGNQVNPLAIDQPTDHDHVDAIAASAQATVLTQVRRKFVWIYGVGDRGEQDGMEAGPKGQVLPAGVRDAYAVIDIGQDEPHHLINMDTSRISKTKQRVVRVNNLVADSQYREKRRGRALITK
jgi:hypothetical protein